MGNELGTFDEWNETRGLQWNLKQFPKHDSLSRLMHDLNEIYRYHKAMHFEEHNPERFRWLMVDNKDQSVFAFQRKVDDDVLVFVYNMTTNYYEYINIPVIEEGVYEEIFNTDKDIYSGWGQYNGAPIQSEPGSFEGLPAHITIKLACLGACIFKLRVEPKPENKVKSSTAKAKSKKK